MRTVTDVAAFVLIHRAGNQLGQLELRVMKIEEVAHRGEAAKRHVKNYELEPNAATYVRTDHGSQVGCEPF